MHYKIIQEKIKSIKFYNSKLVEEFTKYLYLGTYIIILCICNSISLANEKDEDILLDKKSSNIWYIHKSETAPIIFIATKGQIQKEDYLTFMLDSDNCDEVGLTFQITSIMESIPQSDDIFEVLVKYAPGDEYLSKVGIIGTRIQDGYYFTQFMFENLLTAEEVIAFLGDKDSFEIELQKTQYGKDPSIYFDIMHNNWNIKEFRKHFNEAQRKCRHNLFDLSEI